jgi:hypothetical protein
MKLRRAGPATFGEEGKWVSLRQAQGKGFALGLGLKFGLFFFAFQTCISVIRCF